MKKIFLTLAAYALAQPVLLLAQENLQPPASWVQFQQQENAKRQTFDAQMQSDRQEFLSAHPEVKEYFEQVKAAAQARQAQWRAAHPNKNF